MATFVGGGLTPVPSSSAPGISPSRLGFGLNYNTSKEYEGPLHGPANASPRPWAITNRNEYTRVVIPGVGTVIH